MRSASSERERGREARAEEPESRAAAGGKEAREKERCIAGSGEEWENRATTLPDASRCVYQRTSLCTRSRKPVLTISHTNARTCLSGPLPLACIARRSRHLCLSPWLSSQQEKERTKRRSRDRDPCVGEGGSARVFALDSSGWRERASEEAPGLQPTMTAAEAADTRGRHRQQESKG